MNPGLLDEGGKAAVATIDALKSSPMVLALVLINLLLIGLLYYVAMRSGEIREKEMALIVNQQKEVLQLMAQCVVPKKD